MERKIDGGVIVGYTEQDLKEKVTETEPKAEAPTPKKKKTTKA